MIINYINLSSGLIWLDEPTGPINNINYVRIQSTTCEQKRWSEIIEDLSEDFFVHLALGHTCVVWDGSAKKDVSRALYQGLPWILYACELNWYGQAKIPVVRGNNVNSYFFQCYQKLSNRAKKKLTYLKKYVNVPTLNYGWKCKRSDLDGKYSELKDKLVTYYNSEKLMKEFVNGTI
jgi:hypothetical protein